MKLVKTNSKLNPRRTWGTAIDIGFIPHAEHLANFDQNGYDLTPLEKIQTPKPWNNPSSKSPSYLSPFENFKIPCPF